MLNHGYYLITQGEFYWATLFLYIDYPLLGVGACYSFFWYCQRCSVNFADNSVKERVIDDATQKKLKGMGGWLVVILIQLIGTLIYKAVCLFDFLSMSVETIMPITIQWGGMLDKGMLYTLAVMNFVGTILLFITALWALLALFRKASSFKKYYRLFVLSLFVFPVLAAGWFFWGRYVAFYRVQWEIISLFFIWPLAVAFISLPYLTLSRRVRLTLIN